MEKVVVPDPGGNNIEDTPYFGEKMNPDELPRVDRAWEDRFRRRQIVAQVESYLSSNAFILTFLFVYINALFLMYVWGARDEYVYQKGHARRWIITIARGFGYTLNLNSALVILLAARLSFTMLRKTALNRILPFDKTFPAFHIIVGYCILGAVAGHGVFHLIWIGAWNDWKPGIWQINWCVATGAILSTVLVIMVATARQKFRSKNFTTFYAIHNIGAALFFILLGLHGMYRAVPYTWKWIVGPIFVYLLDRIIRKIATSNVSIELSSSNSVLKGPEVLKISMPKSFNYKAGQYAEIKVPSISMTEWHPFTIASAPHEAEMTFFVKAVGDWTNALYSAFVDRIDQKVSTRLQILVRGPFGAPAQHIGGYERIVLVSGGVGSTPFSSICRELHHYIEQQQKIEDDETKLEGPKSVDKEVEEKLVHVVNRKFSVNFGDPRLPSANPAAQEVMRNEMFHLSESASPQPQNPTSFQRLNYADLFPENVTTPGAMRARQSSDLEDRPPTNMPRFPPKARVEGHRKKPSMRKKVGMSFNLGTPGQYQSKLSFFGKNTKDEETLFKEEFKAKTMQLDEKSVAITLGRNLAAMSTRSQRMLGVLHSIFLNLLLFLILLSRMTMIGYAHIFGNFKLTMSRAQFSFTGAVWLFIVDLILGIGVTTLIGMTLILELAIHKGHFFQSKGHLMDLFLLMPFSLASIVLEILIIVREGESVNNSLLAALLFIMVLPVTSFLLGMRLYRIVGSRVMLADHFDDVAYHRMRAVDFIWTTPHAADDAWLLERLIPIADKTKLRLHRYITRETVEDSSDGNKHDDKALQTNYGRPDWDSIFRMIAQRSPSTTKVGVFFCGPKGMAKAVQAALIKAQTLSNLRGTYLGHGDDVDIKSELGAVQVNVAELRRRGSYIRFVFREENFG